MRMCIWISRQEHPIQLFLSVVLRGYIFLHSERVAIAGCGLSLVMCCRLKQTLHTRQVGCESILRSFSVFNYCYGLRGRAETGTHLEY